MFRSKFENTYTAALVIVGNEILSGRTQDANTSWIAEKLTARGIVLAEVRIVPDIGDRIIEAVSQLRRQVDYVFTTGGIGPTHDDITAESIARAFDVKLEQSAEATGLLQKHYGTADLSPARAKMALVPCGAALIPNPVSAAPGFIMENVYVMAGVPRIMQAMFDHVLQALAQGDAVLSNTISCDLAESVIAQRLSRLQDEHSGVEIGSYPHYRGGVPGLSLVVRGTEMEKIQAATRDLVAMIRDLGGTAQAISLQAGAQDL